MRLYLDALKLLFELAAQRSGRQIASLELGDLDVDAIAGFLDHIEINRSNCAATRNNRRVALCSFFKHLIRNDLAHSCQYTRVLAIPSKKARPRPATYLEADDARAIIARPDQRTVDGWRDSLALNAAAKRGSRAWSRSLRLP